MKLFHIALVAFALALPAVLPGCAAGTNQLGSVTLPATPEAQIATGANAETAATVLATTLLRNGKISTAQAAGYSTLLHGASTALDTANGALVTCRASTGSTPATVPDPCALSVTEVIGLALQSINGVKAALSAK